MLSTTQFESAIAGLSGADVWPLDSVFLIDGDRVHGCFNYNHSDVPVQRYRGRPHSLCQT